MKKSLIFIFIGITGIAMANDGKYEKVMLENIAALDKARTLEDFQKVINTLDRVGSAEVGKWEPHYYGAYGKILMSTKVKELVEKDQYLDEAQARLDKAISIQKDNVEIITLQGFIHMMRLAADPAARGQQYAGLAFEVFNKAVAIDERNPRALIMRAQMKQGTAQFFGTSTDEACAEAHKALELLNEQSDEGPSLAPSWGRWNAEKMVKQCTTDSKTTE